MAQDPEAESAPDVVTPIIIDLGKKRRKRIKSLKKGRGRLMDEVTDVVEQVQESLGDAAADKQLVPIVMVYRRRRKRRKNRLFGPIW